MHGEQENMSKLLNISDMKQKTNGFYLKYDIKINKGKMNLAIQSLTMAQYAKEYNDIHNKSIIYDNGGLATVGDAICEAYVMLKKFQYKANEKEMTEEKKILKNDYLNSIGKKLLKDYLFASNNDLNDENKKSYATAFEAVVGFVACIDMNKAFEFLDCVFGL